MIQSAEIRLVWLIKTWPPVYFCWCFVLSQLPPCCVGVNNSVLSLISCFNCCWMTGRSHAGQVSLVHTEPSAGGRRGLSQTECIDCTALFQEHCVTAWEGSCCCCCSSMTNHRLYLSFTVTPDRQNQNKLCVTLAYCVTQPWTWNQAAEIKTNDPNIGLRTLAKSSFRRQKLSQAAAG